MGLFARLQDALQASSSHAESSEDSLQVAAAVLLLEIERADYEHNAQERHAVQSALQKYFRLSAEQAETLINEALDETEQAISLHDYVTVINDQLTAADKLHIIRMLWQVAYADGELHHYEEGLLRQLSDLLHVPHHDFVRIKLQVSGEL